MTAQEAHNKSLWNSLPDILRSRLESRVSVGQFELFWDPALKDNDVNSLIALGYKLEIAEKKYWKITW